jgi:dienelactone hydrolase
VRISHQFQTETEFSKERGLNVTGLSQNTAKSSAFAARLSIPAQAVRIDSEERRKGETAMKYLKFLLAAICLGTGAFVTWALDPMEPEATAYAATISNPSAVIVGSHDGFITIRPTGRKPVIGLLFYPGARVAPEAYVYKLGAIATAADIQIVIGRPPLNLAVFSISQADAMRSALPGVTHWFVGGHSLGGAMACLYASKHRANLEGVVLFGVSCGSDISHSSLRVLSIAGERDGLFPPGKIAKAGGELPTGARFVTVPGMNHAQFGNYGSQSGDHPSAIEDAVALEALSSAATQFFFANREAAVDLGEGHSYKR